MYLIMAQKTSEKELVPQQGSKHQDVYWGSEKNFYHCMSTVLAVVEIETLSSVAIAFFVFICSDIRAVIYSESASFWKWKQLKGCSMPRISDAFAETRN